MPYGAIKVDNITFTNGGADQVTTFSGIYRAITSGVTVIGTISGATIQGATVSGTTVTGTTAQFTNITGVGIGATTITGTTVTGTTAQFTNITGVGIGATTITGTTVTGTTIQGASGTFTSLTGVTATGTTANFVTHNGASGVFTTLLSGTTVTGTTAQFTNITGVGIGATTITGTTVTGTTANFVFGVFTTQLSGVTVTGTTASFTSGNFTALSGASTTVTSGIFAVGSAAAPSISFTSDPNNGLYSPGADQVAISTNGTQRLTVNTAATTSTLPVVHPLGAVGTPSITFTGNLNTGIYSPATDTIAFVKGGAEAMRIDSSGRLGIGTTSPSTPLTVNGAICSLIQGGASTLAYRIDAGGFGQPLLIGHYYDSEDHTLIKVVSAAAGTTASFDISNSGIFKFTGTGSAERARIDTSGRLLVGTSTARSNFFNLSIYSPGIQLEGATDQGRIASIVGSAAAGSGGILILGSQKSGAVGGNTAVTNNGELGILSFQGNDGTEFVEAASITAYVDGTPGANDMPGRLVFSVTADGAPSPTEAMRIKNSRIINIANTPVYADNAAAKTGGLVDGDVYRKSDGTLMIVYT